MSTTISGIRVATPEDVSRVEDRVRALERSAQSLETSVNSRFSEVRNQLLGVESKLREQANALQKLEGSLKDLDNRIRQEVSRLDQTLETISGAVSAETELVKTASGTLGKNNELMGELLAEVSIENTLETSRQQQLSEKFELLLTQQRAQTESLRLLFTELHQQLVELEHAEEIGARTMEESIRMMSTAVESIRANLQEEVINSTQNIQHYTLEKNNRAVEEAARLQGVITLQGQTRDQLETIHKIVQDLAETGQRAEAEQKQRLDLLQEQQAQSLNDHAAYYLQTGEPKLAVALLEQAVKISNNETIRTNLALAYLQIGHFGRAEDILAKLEQQEVFAPQVNHQIGVFHLERSDPGSALPYLEKAAVEAPDDNIILLSLGKALYGCGRVAEAMSAWKLVNEREPALIREDLKLRLLFEEQLVLEEKP